MNSHPSLHDLLSEPGRTVLSPADLLDLLVAASPSELGSTRDQLERFLGRTATHSPELVAEHFGDHVRGLLPTGPPEAALRDPWHAAFDALALALEHLRVLMAVDSVRACMPWGALCERALSQQLAQAREGLCAREDAWLDAARTQLGLSSGLASGAFDHPPLAPQEVIDRWAKGRLHRDDDDALRRIVSSPSLWQTALREWVLVHAGALYALRWDALLVPRIATELDDETAIEWLRLPLPQLELQRSGSPACLVVRSHRDGTLWQLVQRSGVEAKVVPYECSEHIWNCGEIGEIHTSITLRVPSARETRSRAVSAVESMAYGGDTVAPQAFALARDLAHGPFVQALARGAQAFRDGEEGEAVNDACAWAELALRARIALDILAARDEGALLDLLIDADRALAPHAEALLLLDDGLLAEITRHEANDPDAWWCPMAPSGSFSVERAVAAPTRMIDLSQKRAKTRGTERAPMSLAAASFDAPSPVGFVAEVLLPLVDSKGSGHLARLRVWHDPQRGMRRSSTVFRLIAGESLHAAFQAAERVCGKRSRFPWEDHAMEVSLVEDPQSLEIDGHSLGLAAFLGFVSCWCERPIASGVAASARIVDRRVAPVEQIAEKQEALCRHSRDAKLLVHPRDAAVLSTDARVRSVSTLQDALEAAGLPYPVPSFEPAEGTLAQQREELSRLANWVEAQDIKAFEGFGVEPWRLLAERLAWLCDAIEKDNEGQVNRPRVLAALAFVHAGDVEAAERELARSTGVEGEASVSVLREVVGLSRAIDAQEMQSPTSRDWTSADAQAERIATLLPTLPSRDRRELLGQALGTQGNLWLHTRRLDQAIASFEQAWRHHRDELPREAMRSSVTCSMALREAGRFSEALARLDEGGRLREPCRRFSRDYSESCEMFWNYERGRVLLALGEPQGAATALTDALTTARDRGWWPGLGVLRALAWSATALGDEAAHAQSLSEMAEIARGLSEGLQGFAARLMMEARGAPAEGREIY